MVKPIVDKNLCTGCGLCITIYPEVFEFGPDGKSQVKGECQDEEKCREAKDVCPVQAISLEE